MIGTITKDKSTNKFNLHFEVFQTLNGVETQLDTWDMNDLDTLYDARQYGVTSTGMEDGHRWCRTSVGLHFGWIPG
ncbi:MAG: hypothetical protein AB7T49_02845 [Oligoflexales bacterium]